MDIIGRRSGAALRARTAVSFEERTIMKTPELSQRLMSAVGFVRGGFLADVGTDHAHLPVYLYQLGKIRGAVASDVNEGPLARAKANIAAYGAEKGIATELSDGLARLAPYQPDDIVIFGMGGELIIRIIEDADWVKNGHIRLILQPMTKLEEVRRYLLKYGFFIVDEAMSEDDGKIYQTVCAEYRPEATVTPYSRAELLLGRHNIERGGALFARYLRHRIEVLTVAAEGKRKAGRSDAEQEALIGELTALAEKEGETV